MHRVNRNFISPLLVVVAMTLATVSVARWNEDGHPPGLRWWLMVLAFLVSLSSFWIRWRPPTA